MRTKRSIMRHINTLYIIFFAAIALSLVFGVTGDEFRSGFQDGQQMARQKYGEPSKFSTILYGIQNKTSLREYDIPLTLSISDSNITAAARVNSFEIKVCGPGKSPFPSAWSMVVLTLSTLCYAAVFVMIFVIITSIRKSLRRGNIFERRNIMRARAIGILLIVSSLCSSVGEWLDNSSAAGVISSVAQFAVDTSFHFSGSELITAILILFIAEVFAIGYDITEEQKLTI